MSTRRSTRAASRQATPAVNGDIPSTPAPARRTARRAGNTPLPAVSLKPSTAYGTNTIAQPAAAAGPIISEQINDVLKNLLKPVANPDPDSPPSPAKTSQGAVRLRASASRSRSGTPRSGRHGSTGNKSFNDESNIFGDAHIASSSVGYDDDEEVFVPDAMAKEAEAERAAIQQIADRRVEENRDRNILGRSLSTKISDKLDSVWNIIEPAFHSWIFKLTGWAIIFILFFSLVACFLDGISPDSVGRFIPWVMRHPTDYFQSDEVQAIHERVNALEYEVKAIKKQSSVLDLKAISKLQDILPDKLIVKKDGFGSLVLSDDFWHALQDKIRADDTLIPDPVGSTPEGNSSPLTQRQLGKIWENFITKNQAKLETYAFEEVARKFPKLLEDNQVATREEVIETIRNIWADNKKQIRSELVELTRKWERTSESIKALESGSRGLTKEAVKIIAQDTINKLIPHAQLDALTRAKLNANVNYGLTRLNYFSEGTGAAIDPKANSPTYVPPKNKAGSLKKFQQWALGNPIPVPHGPKAALTSWEEQGDCWCSPWNAEGESPSLSVIMGSDIFPEEVVVEHILPSASSEPGATPRDMELLAHVADNDRLSTIRSLSDQIFPENHGEDYPEGYVRVAKWTYDIESSNNVQVFPLSIDLKCIGAYTNKLIVRAKNNWGAGAVGYTCLYRVRVHGEMVASPGSY